MKFFGQFIQDFIARFRNDVYLEDISTGTIASGGNLGLDSNNKIVKANIAASIDHDSLLNFVAAEHYRWDTDISSTATIHTNNITDLHGAGVSGSSGNLLVDDGDGTVTSHANVHYSATHNNFSILSDTSQRPIFNVSNGNTDAEAPEIQLRKSTTVADGDDLGKVIFAGIDTDGLGNDAIFAQILGEVQEADNNSEEGKLTLSVASHDQELQPGLIMASGNAEDEVDVTIANGSTSLTTIQGSLEIAGSLTMGSTSFVNSSGVVQVATQGTIDHDSLANFVANEHIDWTTDQGSTNIHSGNYDNTQLSNEQVQDIVGAMFTGNTETNITATYQDSDGTIDLVSTDTNTQLSEEQVREIAGTASASSAGLVELATTAEADTGTDTARAVTPAGLKSHVGARFTYQYISFTGNADISTNWATPGTNGPFTHNYNTDTGINGTSVGSTTYNFARSKQNGFVVPFDSAVLVGFYGMIRNNTANNQGALGLFHSTYATFGAKTTTSTFTLQAYAAADQTGGAGTSYQGFTKAVDLSRSLDLTAGDIIIPAILQANEKAYAQFTIVIKTPII